ncbi:hypothetical protein FD754_002942 [Muntiacus muntjak]|uniref:G-protein coupled receptors family 1 profile domain-containing protein n=1 Tax=Muntiacus muntjak TaxID=9888 RepID=A0A5N3WEQ0_MUNMU|nr:hypothetical protein FD754_002942 [Muntiacus muntjak]
MDGENCSSLKEFLLLGISSSPVIKVTLFTMFLVVYLIILVANLGMIILVRTDPQLHTPMYFFLSHLSFSDLCYSTAIGPRMLAGFLIKNKSTPFYGCALQFLIFFMAYDRYLAISNPLLYTIKVPGKLCSLLMAGVRHVQQRLFLLFLLVYSVTVVTNVGMSLLIKVDPRLHTPMYHFLSNLSFCDVCYSSAVSPKMLADFLSEHKRIPFDLCAIQMYFWGTFADVECLMLADMAYDRHVAICNLLLYTVSMSRRLCTQLISVVHMKVLVDSAIHTCYKISNSFFFVHFLCTCMIL